MLFSRSGRESVLEEVLDGVTAAISDARRDFSFLFGVRDVRWRIWRSGYLGGVENGQVIESDVAP